MVARKRYESISDQEAAYLSLLISEKSADSRKAALERISKLYRMNKRFRNPERIVPLILYQFGHNAEKVRRWAFNALALVGSRDDVPAVVAALDQQRDDPDAFAAAIACLAALADEDQTRLLLKKNDLAVEGFVLLAAAQQNPVFSAELQRTRINIDNADAADLRLATLLLGLRKAPENLLSAKFTNKQVIGELNFYNDRLVSQYSVWAAYEDRGMSISDLKILPKDFDSYHSGIRKYGYRLMTANKTTAKKNHEYIVHASEDRNDEAREGLAVGLRDVFFDGVEELVFDWFKDEASDPIRARLLEHMAVNAERAPVYRTPVLQNYERLPSGGIGRAQLDAAAAGTSLFQEMRRIEYEGGMSDLFNIPNNTTSAAEPTLATADDGPVSAGILAASVKVLIVTALPKEAAAVRATLSDRRKLSKPNDPGIYNVGDFLTSDKSPRRVLTVNAGMGKVSASTLGATALQSFPKIEHIVMVGIAGGCPNRADPEKHVRLGDIVFTGPDDGVLEYDFVKKTDAGSEIRRAIQKPSARLSAAAGELMTDAIAGERPWENMTAAIIAALPQYARPGAADDVLWEGEEVVAHPVEPSREPGQPKVMNGVIGSADTLQKSTISRDKLRDEYGVRAIEMEASGLQSAAWAQSKDIFVVRGICDYCDTHKNDIWQNYAAAVAAGFTQALIEAMPDEWF